MYLQVYMYMYCSDKWNSSTSFTYTDQLEAQKIKNSSQLGENDKVNLHNDYM